MAIRVEDFLENHLNSEEDISNMTVPLRIDIVSQFSGPAVLSDEDALIGERTEIPAHTRRRFEKRSASDAVDALREFGLKPDDEEEFYQLEGGDLYGIQYAGDITIPRGHVGIVFPNEQLVNAGATLFTSVYTPETEPPLEGTLRVDANMLLKKDLRVGSLLVFETEDVTTGRMAKLLKRSLSQDETAESNADTAAETNTEQDEGAEESGAVEALPESEESSNLDDG